MQKRDGLAEKLSREPPIVSGRPPPHDLEAEAAVICAMMLTEGGKPEELAVPTVRGMLEPSDFYSQAHELVVEAIFWLSDRNIDADVLMVKNRLDELGQLRAVDISYLASLLDSTPAIYNVAQHAKIVRDFARLRAAIQVCGHFGAVGYTVKSNESSAYLDELAGAVFKVVQDEATSPIIKLDEAVDGVEQRLNSDEQSVELRGMLTKYSKLDEKYRMRLGDLTIIGARPGMGKTSFALNVATNVAGTDPATLGEDLPSGVAILSLEMPREQVATKMVCSAASVSVYVALNQPAELSQPDRDSLTEAAGMLRPLPIWIDDTPGLTLGHVRAKLQLMSQKAKQAGSVLRLAIIDYLQLMAGDKRMSREQQLSEISRGLKTLAKQMKIHIIALSQLNRSVETQKIPIPSLAHLRESGALEQDADSVLFIYRHDYYVSKGMVEPDEELKGCAMIIVEKQRNGPSGTILLRFAGFSTTFYTLPDRDFDREEFQRGPD